MIQLTQSQKIYFKYISLSMFFVFTVASLQFYVNYGGLLKPQLYVAPILVSFVLGALLASQRVLRLKFEAERAKFGAIVDMAEEFSYIQQIDGAYSYVSPASETLTGHSPAVFLNQPLFFESLIFEEDLSKFKAYQDKLSQHVYDNAVEIRLTHKNGQIVWVRHSRRVVRDEDVVVAFSVTNTNITRYIEQEAALQEMVFTDPLTHLPNRRYLKEHLAKLLGSAQPFSLAMMDLNRFKYVNDTLGHTVGDKLLVDLSHKIQTVLPSNASFARFGGDEFVFVVDESVDMPLLISEVCEVIKQPVDLAGQRLQVSASFGWVRAPEDGQDVDSLIKFADAAMYEAKRTPGLSVQAYRNAGHQGHERLLKIEHKLGDAVLDGKIVPFFQPMVDTQTLQVAGVECLARWQDEEMGTIYPDEFIPLAEATGLIVDLGYQILDKALEVGSRLNANEGVEVYFSVNISPIQLFEEAFVGNVEQLIKRHQFPVHLLKLEVTESLFMGGDIQARETLMRLRKLGVQIALDDFGTGYAALAVLRDACLDVLKIDKSFVSAMTEGNLDQILVKQIVEMAHAMNLKVVAEGVETQAHQDFLRSIGCDYSQGYLWSRPVAEATFCGWLREKMER